MKRLILVFVFIGLSLAEVFAANVNWTGAVSSTWSVAGNWSNNAIPTNNDDVIIPAGVSNMPQIITTANNVLCKAVTINSGATLSILSGVTFKFTDLTCDGTFTNNGTANASGWIKGRGTIINTGTLTVASNFLLSGVFTNTSAQQVVITGNFDANCAVNNSGSIKVSGTFKSGDNKTQPVISNTGNIVAQNVDFYGTFTSSSTSLAPSTVVGNFTIRANASFVNSGYITVNGNTDQSGYFKNQQSFICKSDFTGAAESVNTGTLQVDGQLKCNDNFNSSNSLKVNGSLMQIAGNTDLSGTVTLGNNVQFNVQSSGNLIANCALSISKDLVCNGTMVAKASLSVAGTTSGSGQLKAEQSFNCSSDLSNSGAAKFIFVGPATIGAKVSCDASMTFVNTLSAKDFTVKTAQVVFIGNSTINGILSGEGTILNTGNMTVTSDVTNNKNANWAFAGNNAFNGNLTVNGLLATTGTLTVSKDMYAATSGTYISNNATIINGNLGTTGGPYFEGVFNLVSGDITVKGKLINNGLFNHYSSGKVNLLNGGGNDLGGTGKFNRIKINLVEGSTCNVINNIDSIYSVQLGKRTKFDIKDKTVQILNSIKLDGVVINGDTLNKSIFKMNNSTVRFYGTELIGFIDNYVCDKGIFDFANDSRNSSQGIVSAKFYDLKISNKTGQTVKVGSGGADSVIVLHNFEIVPSQNVSNTLAYLASNLRVEGTFTIGKNCTLDTYNQSGQMTDANVSSISVKGDWINNGSFIARSSNVNINGSNPQAIRGTSPTSFFKLALSNSRKDLTFYTNVTVGYNDNTISNAGAGGLTMLGDNILLNGNTLTIAEKTANGIVNKEGLIISEDASLNAKGQANNASKVCWKIGDNKENHVIPFGYKRDIAINFEIQNTNNNPLGDMTVATYRPKFGGHTGTRADSLNPMPNKVKHLNISGVGGNSNNSNYMVKRFWQIDRSNGSGTPDVTVKFTYTEKEGDERPEDNTGGREKDLRAQRYDTLKNAWDPILPNQVSDPVANTVTVSHLSKFSPWALTKAISPLPVTLTSFKAVELRNEQAAQLVWSTASELNFDHFEIEKLVGSSYISLGQVQGSVYVSTIKNYSFTDRSAAKGWNTYRLKIVDQSGNVEYSSLATVAISAVEKVNLYPNPVAANLHINGLLEGSAINIMDMNGSLILSLPAASSIDLSSLSAGQYILNAVAKDGSNFSKLFIKE